MNNEPIQFTTHLELETLKNLVRGNIRWNLTRPVIMGLNASRVVDYIHEEGRIPTFKKIEAATFEELLDLIHDIYDENLDWFIRHELEAFAESRPH